MSQPQVAYQVFISSTFDGLSEQRAAAWSAVVKEGHIPIALEHSPVTGGTDVEVIEEAIKGCQIFLMILGEKCGSVVPGLKKSYVELEYELAIKHGLEILVFAHKDLKNRYKSIERADGAPGKEATTAPDVGGGTDHERLGVLYGKISGNAKPWDSATRIELEVTRALYRFLLDAKRVAKAPAPFFRAPQGFDNRLVTLVTENEFIRQAVLDINSFEKLAIRSHEGDREKAALARFLVQLYGERIRDGNIGLFFESGSTPAYVAREVRALLWGTNRPPMNGDESITIRTNNALAFLQFWLGSQVPPCLMFPWGSPDPTFGASYGPIGKLVEQDPEYPPLPLQPRERAAMKELTRMPHRLKPTENTLIIGAISGLQLADDPKSAPESGYSKVDGGKYNIKECLSSCRGFHVGSYHNKIFKRYLYSTGLPIVVCIHHKKIDAPIRVGHCHFLFDEELRWDDFIKNHPLAICVGCDRASVGDLADRFDALGFDVVSGSEAPDYTSVLARNAAFVTRFEKKQQIEPRSRRRRPRATDAGALQPVLVPSPPANDA